MNGPAFGSRLGHRHPSTFAVLLQFLGQPTGRSIPQTMTQYKYMESTENLVDWHERGDKHTSQSSLAQLLKPYRACRRDAHTSPCMSRGHVWHSRSLSHAGDRRASDSLSHRGTVSPSAKRGGLRTWAWWGRSLQPEATHARQKREASSVHHVSACGTGSSDSNSIPTIIASRPFLSLLQTLRLVACSVSYQRQAHAALI